MANHQNRSSIVGSPIESGTPVGSCFRGRIARAFFRDNHDLLSVTEHIGGLDAENRIGPLEQVVWRCESMLNLTNWFEGLEIGRLHRETTEFIIESFDDIPNKFHQAALSLIVSQLREARFSGDEGRYKTVLEFLNASPHLTRCPELLNMVRYQQGICAASYCDEDALNRIVDNWPTVGDVYWQVRRAGLMLDAFRLQDACNVLNSALMAIRSRQNRKQTSIFLRSREAYALFVQRVALAKLRLDEGDILRASPDIEWDRFNSIRSNPNDEVTYFQTRLAVTPTWRPGTTRRRSFDPGNIQTSTSSSGDRVDEKIDAREWLAFCEKVGLSPHLVQQDKELHERAFSRTAYASPRGGFHAMLRCRIAEEVGDSAIMRCRVATMSQEDVTETYTWLADALSNAILRLQRHSVGPKRPLDAEANVKNVADAFSFLYCRLDETQLNQEAARLQRLYFTEAVRHSGWIHEVFITLWERLIAALPTEVLKELVSRWITYPLPNELGFEVQKLVQPGWPDPARIALHQEHHRLQEYGDEIYTRSKDAIKRLVDTHVGSENPDHRLFASLRVGLLHHIRPLSTKIQKRFSNELWAKVDDRGLPKGTGFQPVFFLSLPSNDSVNPESLLRQMMDVDLAPTHPAGVFADDYFEVARQLTISELDNESRGIAWTDDEIRSFVNRINEWWGKCSAGEALAEDEFFGRPERNRFDAIALFLLAISTSFRVEHDTDTMALDKTIESMFNQRSHSYLLLSKAIMRPELARNCEDRIVDVLMGDDENLISWVIGALYRWVRWSTASNSRKQLPQLSEMTVNKISVLARLHRQPCLKGVLELLGTIVSTRPSDSKLHTECVATLATLDAKATYKIEPWSRPGQIDPAEVPAIRVGAASLARQLKIAGVDHPVVSRWRQGTMSDPLPEVRRAAMEE